MHTVRLVVETYKRQGLDSYSLFANLSVCLLVYNNLRAIYSYNVTNNNNNNNNNIYDLQK